MERRYIVSPSAIERKEIWMGHEPSIESERTPPVECRQRTKDAADDHLRDTHQVPTCRSRVNRFGLCQRLPFDWIDRCTTRWPQTHLSQNDFPLNAFSGQKCHLLDSINSHQLCSISLFLSNCLILFINSFPYLLYLIQRSHFQKLFQRSNFVSSPLNWVSLASSWTALQLCFWVRVDWTRRSAVNAPTVQSHLPAVFGNLSDYVPIASDPKESL